MKTKTIVFLFLFINIFQLFLANATSVKADEVNLFVEQYRNGINTGDVIHFNLKIYKIDKKMEWWLSEELFQNDDLEKCTLVSLNQSSSECNYSLPGIKNIFWEPGKIIRFDYHFFGKDLKMEIKKNGSGEYDWDLKAKGKIKSPMSPDGNIWELKGVKSLKLKNNKLMFYSMFR